MNTAGSAAQGERRSRAGTRLQAHRVCVYLPWETATEIGRAKTALAFVGAPYTLSWMKQLKNPLSTLAAIVGLYVGLAQVMPKIPPEVIPLAIIGAVAIGALWPK